jgi:hypothetical protein
MWRKLCILTENYVACHVQNMTLLVEFSVYSKFLQVYDGRDTGVQD